MFDATMIHRVNIYNRDHQSYWGKLGNFNLKWKDESQNWHMCTGSPYVYPAEVGPISYNCVTPDVAIAIEIQRIGSGEKLRLAEVEIYGKQIDETKLVATTGMSGLTDEVVVFTDLDLDTSNKDLFVSSCSLVGCGLFSLSAFNSLGLPSVATEVSFGGGSDANTLTVTGKLPVHDGGYDLTEYKFVVVGAIGSKITLTGESMSTESSGNYAVKCTDGIIPVGNTNHNKYCSTQNDQSNNWFEATFAPTFVHTVKIWNQQHLP